jgi:hypothetical protein
MAYALDQIDCEGLLVGFDAGLKRGTCIRHAYCLRRASRWFKSKDLDNLDLSPRRLGHQDLIHYTLLECIIAPTQRTANF